MEKRAEYFKTNEEWHEWLEINHSVEQEIWLVFFKKHTNVISLDYNESVKEALCFGWIDSLIKRLDSERYCRKFTPRKNWAKWSAVNIKRMSELIDSKRMTPFGSDRFDRKLLSSNQVKSKEFTIPSYIKKAFKNEPQAAVNFTNLPSSHQKKYVGWIDSAKREQTKIKRLDEAIQFLKSNKRLGMK